MHSRLAIGSILDLSDNDAYSCDHSLHQRIRDRLLLCRFDTQEGIIPLRFDVASLVRGSPGREASAGALLARLLVKYYLGTLHGCWSAKGLNVRKHTVHLVLLMYLIGFSYCNGNSSRQLHIEYTNNGDGFAQARDVVRGPPKIVQS